MRVYLFRHAESESQANLSILLSKADENLGTTEKGNIERHRAADWFCEVFSEHAKSEPFKLRMIVSPWERTVQTSAPTIAKLGMKKDGGYIESVEKHPLLVERRLGDWAGHEEHDIPARFPREHAAYLEEVKEKGEYVVRRPGAESFQDVEDRMRAIFPEIQKAACEGVTDLILVGHSRAHSILHKMLTDMPTAEYKGKGAFGNCYVRMLEIAPEGKVTDHGFVYAPDYDKLPISSKPAGE